MEVFQWRIGIGGGPCGVLLAEGVAHEDMGAESGAPREVETDACRDVSPDVGAVVAGIVEGDTALGVPEDDGGPVLEIGSEIQKEGICAG